MSSPTDQDHQRLREEADRDAKDINLNCVRIAFEAFDCSSAMHYAICEPIYSRPVANQSE